MNKKEELDIVHTLAQGHLSLIGIEVVVADSLTNKRLPQIEVQRAMLIQDLARLRLAYEDATRRLVAAKDNPVVLRELVEQLDEFGPNGPAGIGLGQFGGHANGDDGR